jgi:hypothetical protein
VATLIVTLIVGITKFAIGAWVPIVVVPMIILLFKAIKRHYVSVSEALVVQPGDMPSAPHRHTFVVLVGRVHKGVVEAINYAVSLRPDHVVAIHISDDKEDHERIHDEWDRYGFDIPLEILDSPYRELVAPVERHLDDLDRRYGSDRTTVLIPEFVVGVRSISNLLHGQSGLGLKIALLGRPNTIVASVPFHVGSAAVLDPDAPVEMATGRTAPLHELDRERRARRFEESDGGTVRIADAPLRVPTQIAGEVTGLRVVPKAGSPWLEVTVDDGSGSAVLIFTGRKRVPGIMPGRAIIAEGVARDEHSRLTILNPRYSLHE